MGWNWKFLFIYLLPALLTPLPHIPFTIEEIPGCTNEAAKGAHKAGRNPPSWFFYFVFTISVTSSINTFDYSNDFMILTISFISSFEINNVKTFTALTTPFPLIFLSNLFIALEAKLLTNPVKLSLAKGIVKSFITFLFLFT